MFTTFVCIDSKCLKHPLPMRSFERKVLTEIGSKMQNTATNRSNIFSATLADVTSCVTCVYNPNGVVLNHSSCMHWVTKLIMSQLREDEKGWILNSVE